LITYICEKCGLKTNTSVCPHCGGRSAIDKSELFWCSHCNIPTYDEVCPICGNHGKYFTSDARPVFPEERLLLEIMIGKPFCFEKDFVWNGSGNRYYVNGKKINLKFGDYSQFDINDIRIKVQELRGKNSYEYFNNQIQLFLQANIQRYNYITTEACAWINQEAEKYDNSSMFVSFSGGKDSTVVSSLVLRALGRPDIIHIFGNTTLEFPSTYEYVKRFRANNRQTPLLTAQNKEQDFFNLCETFGPPSRTLRWCCTIFKTGFIGDKILKTFKDKTAILTFYGIRRMESASRNKYERKDESPKISKQKVTSPIIDWSESLFVKNTGNKKENVVLALEDFYKRESKRDVAKIRPLITTLYHIRNAFVHEGNGLDNEYKYIKSMHDYQGLAIGVKPFAHLGLGHVSSCYNELKALFLLVIDVLKNYY